MKLATKLPLLIALPAILVLLVGGTLQIQTSARAMQEDLRIAYELFVDERSQVVDRWLQDSQVDLLALGQSYAVTEAIKSFSSAWASYDGPVAEDLRRLYIEDNPHPIGKKDELVTAADGSEWSAAHERFHVGLRAYQKARGYYDLFLFDMQGDLVYSVFKEDDFALNFRTGAYANSGLGEVFQEGIGLPNGAYHMTEIAPYAPSADAPALFMSTPVFEKGTQIGLVAIQLPLGAMAAILSESSILGETGSLFLVDSNGRALNNSRHEGGFETLGFLPQTDQVSAALSGEGRFFSSTTGVAGMPVVAVTRSFQTPAGKTWGMVFEINRSEALALISNIFITSMIELALVGVVLAAIAWFAVRGVIRRVNRLAHEMDEIAAQNFATDIAGQDKQDEIGFISRTLENLKLRLEEGEKAQAREKETQADNAKVVTLLSTALSDLASGDFRNEVLEYFPEEHKKLRYSINDAMSGLNEVIGAVRETAINIERGSGEIASAADDLSQRTESQAATLAETAASLENVTTSVRSATEKVTQIETTVLTAREKAEASGKVVGETIDAMSEIEKSSNQIAQIISVIDDIAFQTNLLALNAGVEAARAGEAGRGFAVVASEVRGLAQRSSEAAREIKTLIDSSSDQVGRGVQMVGRTGDALNVIITEVRDISEMIKQVAASSREQSSSLSEINSGMTSLDQSTQQNAAMAEENTAAAQVLRSDADRLLGDVGKFKTSDGEGGVRGHAPQGATSQAA